MMFVAYGVCHIMMFVANYDICRLYCLSQYQNKDWEMRDKRQEKDLGMWEGWKEAGGRRWETRGNIWEKGDKMYVRDGRQEAIDKNIEMWDKTQETGQEMVIEDKKQRDRNIEMWDKRQETGQEIEMTRFER